MCIVKRWPDKHAHAFWVNVVLYILQLFPPLNLFKKASDCLSLALFCFVRDVMRSSPTLQDLKKIKPV